MESRAHAIAAGLFTVVLGIGVLVVAMWLSREDFDYVTYVLESQYSVSGLNPQAPVRLRGVPIGKVQSINFDDENPKMILITILVKGGSSISKGTTAQLNAQGITGTSYVMLEDDGKYPEFRPPSTDKGNRIPVKRSLLDTVTSSGQEILYEAHMVARQVQELLSAPNQAKLVGAFSAVEEASRKLGALAKSLEPGARGVAVLSNDARKTLAHVDGAMQSLAPAMREIGPTLQEARNTLTGIDKLAREYTQRADALERVARSAEQLGGSTQGAATAITEDISPRLNALLEELSRTSRNLDRLLGELNEQPSGLVFGRQSGRPGPGEAGYRVNGAGR